MTFPTTSCNEHDKLMRDAHPVATEDMTREQLLEAYEEECSQYGHVCRLLDAEREKKADATLTARIAELEGQLAAVNERLTKAQSVLGTGTSERVREELHDAMTLLDSGMKESAREAIKRALDALGPSRKESAEDWAAVESPYGNVNPPPVANNGLRCNGTS